MPPACLLYPRFHSIVSFLRVDPFFIFEGSSGLPWPGQQHSGYKVSVSQDCYPYLVFAAPTVDEADWLWRWHDMLYTHGMIWNAVLMISRHNCFLCRYYRAAHIVLFLISKIYNKSLERDLLAADRFCTNFKHNNLLKCDSRMN